MGDLRITINEMHKYCSDMLKDIVQLCEKEDIQYYAIYGTLLGTIRHKGPIPWDPDVDLYVPNNEIERFVNSVEKYLGDKYWVDFRNGKGMDKPFPRVGLRGYETEILHIDIFRMSGLPNGKTAQHAITKRGRRLWVMWKAKSIVPRVYYTDKRKVVMAYFLKLITAPISINYIIKTIDKLCSKYEVFSTDYVGRVMGQGAIYNKSFFEGYERKKYSNFIVRVPQKADELLTIMYGNYKEIPSKDYRDKMMDKKYVIKEIK